MAKTDKQVAKDRLALLAKITSADFNWFDVALEYKAKAGGTATVTVQVCNPLRIDGFYLPVSALETFSLAKRLGWLPLTRAVADQAFNQAKQFIFTGWYPKMLDYEGYTEKVLSKIYDPLYSSNLVAGSHKLWLLSKAFRRSTNYGFYQKTGGAMPWRSPHLKGGWNVVQDEGGAHDENHWDYSQLLQLMKSDSLTIDGTDYKLGEAIVAGLEAVWDEPTKLRKSEIPIAPPKPLWGWVLEDYF